MPNFNEVLSKLGYLGVLSYETYAPPVYSNTQKVFDILDTVILNNLKTLVVGDYDVDGLMCNICQKDTFDYIGYTNYDIFRYRERTHNIDRQAIIQCIQGRYDCIIIMDTGSSDLELLKQLIKYGVLVIVLDHHVSNRKLEDFDIPGLAIINTTFENKVLKDQEICVEDKYKLSAGALVYTVCDAYIKHRDLKELESIRAYALISLYADCMDMSNALNRSIYYATVELDMQDIPTCVKYFFGVRYKKFTRRFIEYWFSPRINSLFRSENFEHLNYFFLERNTDASTIARCLAEIDEIYENNRQFINRISDIIQYDVLDNFVVANMGTLDKKFEIEKNKLYNYTGLLAQKLSDKNNKPAVVYCESGSDIKGSVRDKFSRNYLDIFANFCKAGGHNPAFGFKLSKFELENFNNALARVDKYYSINEIANSPIIILHEVNEPNENLIYDMALYNDFSGNNLPVAYISKSYVGSIKKEYSIYSDNVSYSWGNNFKLQVNRNLNFGEKMLLKPIKSNQIKLIVQ